MQIWHQRRRRRGGAEREFALFPPPKWEQYFSGKHRVKFGHFINLSSSLAQVAPKVDWAPTPMSVTVSVIYFVFLCQPKLFSSCSFVVSSHQIMPTLLQTQTWKLDKKFRPSCQHNVVEYLIHSNLFSTVKIYMWEPCIYVVVKNTDRALECFVPAHGGCINALKSRLDKSRPTRVGFLWINPISFRPHRMIGYTTMRYKVRYNCESLCLFWWQ